MHAVSIRAKWVASKEEGNKGIIFQLGKAGSDCNFVRSTSKVRRNFDWATNCCAWQTEGKKTDGFESSQEGGANGGKTAKLRSATSIIFFRFSEDIVIIYFYFEVHFPACCSTWMLHQVSEEGSALARRTSTYVGACLYIFSVGGACIKRNIHTHTSIMKSALSG